MKTILVTGSAVFIGSRLVVGKSKVLKTYQRVGHLFQDRFKSEPVRSALPLATAGTQERHGLLHRTAEIYPSKSS